MSEDVQEILIYCLYWLIGFSIFGFIVFAIAHWSPDTYEITQYTVYRDELGNVHSSGGKKLFRYTVPHDTQFTVEFVDGDLENPKSVVIKMDK